MKVLFTIVFLFIISFSYSQDTKDVFIEKSDSISYSAKEKILHTKLQDALKAKDYNLADEYLSKLKKLNKFKSEVDLFKSGFYVDALVGLGLFSVKNINAPNTTISSFSPSLRFGNKWFLSGNEKSKIGFNLIYLRAVFFLTPNSNANLVSNSILNFGLSHLSLSKNKKNGFEININTGYNILSEIQGSSIVLHGLNLNPNINIKIKNLSYGVDLLSSFYFFEKDVLIINLLSFSFGAKF